MVGIDTQDKQLGVFFPTDGALKPTYCIENNLYNASAREDLGLPVVEGESYGFFSASGRVKSQRFRGERSDGLWMPISSLAYTGFDVSRLKEGDTFCELNGETICEKYYTPATRRAMAGNRQSKSTRRETLHFRVNPDTPPFRYVADSIKKGSVCWITEKLHGTSGRFGLAMDDVQLPWWKQAVNKLSPIFPTADYRYLNGSRNVILEHADQQDGGYYGSNDFRYEAIDGCQLHKGETIYFEIVGWVNDTTPIMATQGFEQGELAKSLKRAGFQAPMTYTYGCPVGTRRTYIYRITQTNPDGVLHDLSWPQVVARSKELGIPTVPVLHGPFIHDGNSQALRELVERFTGHDAELLTSTLDSSHIREGVVLRAEHEEGVAVAKNKSFAFGCLEGYLKERSEVVDLEEVA